MKISARNQFQGRITRLAHGPINSEVAIALPGGDELVAVVTTASARDLGLAVGGTATAIVKAPWVIVVTGEDGLRFSARNQWRGTVSAVKPGAVNADVAITLAGGAVVHAVITLDALAELGLAVGMAARAIVKASHVVLAV